MKKTLFAIATFAVLAMSCVKEQQPSTPADSAVVTSLRVSVADTKVSVNEATGACTWQEGDQIAVWYDDPNSEETKDGQKVVFTYKGLLDDGTAEFTTAETIQEGYVATKVAHPVGSINSTGGFSHVRDYVYDASRIPIYVRTETVVTNPDGSLSAQLDHNATIMQFELRDIPAYAAGFVVKTSGDIKIKTSFPYKTGYSENIVLNTAVPHSRQVESFYLIDGDGDVIEGTVKTFKYKPTTVKGEFIKMGLVDFQKANLRKDYVKVCGIKWAKGNLVFDRNSTWITPNEDYQSGWGIYDAQWKYLNYDSSLGGSGKYTNSADYYDHFNYAGIGRRSRFASVIITSTSAKFDISGKIFSGYDPSSVTTLQGMNEVSGEDCFKSAAYNVNVTLDDGKEICGDIAFWATKGKYKMPTAGQLQVIGHPTNSVASYQFGYYMSGNVKINGVLFTTPIGDVVRNTNSIEFTDADLECGLFLPLAGRRGPRYKVGNNYVADDGYNSESIINGGTQGLYRSSTFGSLANNSHENSTVLVIGTNELKYGYTNGSVLKDANGAYVDNTMSNRAGGSIRPVLVD